MQLDDARFDTRAIHAGQEFDPTTGAVIPPIYLTSTYVQDGIGGLRDGYEYSRGGNPTRTALETQLAALEGGIRGLSFASGLAAEDALLRTVLAPGDHVVHRQRRLRRHAPAHPPGLRRLGRPPHDRRHERPRRRARGDRARHHEGALGRDAVEPADEDHRISRRSPSSATRPGVLVVVDNTFASPALQQPLALGADVVVHSTTKYLGGHSDVVGGALVFAAGDSERGRREGRRSPQFAAGAVSGPFDAFLTSRGIKTLGIRMQRHSENALAIARAARGARRHRARVLPGPRVAPRATSSPRRQMSGFGGMISISLSGGAEAARRFAESTTLFQLAESLGGVESLVNYPSEMTHASVRGTEAEVPESVVRLSVGIEDVDDLLADIDEALARL